MTEWPRELWAGGHVTLIYNQQCWDWLTMPLPPRLPDPLGFYYGIPIIECPEEA